MINSPLEKKLRSRSIKMVVDPSKPSQTSRKESTLVARTPTQTSGVRGRGRGGSRATSATNTPDPNTTKPPQVTKSANQDNSKSGAIPKSSKPDPIVQARNQEGQEINNLLDIHISSGANSMQDLLGTQRPNQYPADMQGATSSLNDYISFSQPNLNQRTESQSLQEELILCKRLIKELSLQMNQRNTQDSRTENPSLSLKNPSARQNSLHNLNKTRPSSIRNVVFEPEIERDSDSVSTNDSEEEITQSPPARNRRQHRTCEMDKWRIKFTGGNGIKFLKKVAKLQKAYEYDDETVFKYFYLLLDGHALEWYWQYSDQYETSNFAHLKREFERVFKPRESDMMLVSEMYNRKQGQETFEKFYNDIVDINFTLKMPLSDQQLIEILRTNMADDIRQRIFTYETTDRIKFFHKANQAYHDALKTKEKRKPSHDYRPQRKFLHEIDFEEMSSNEIEEISLKLDKWKNQRAERKCFNCHLPGHLLAECPEEITRFFCFRCGMEDTTTPKCSRCSPKGNRSVD